MPLKMKRIPQMFNMYHTVGYIDLGGRSWNRNKNLLKRSALHLAAQIRKRHDVQSFLFSSRRGQILIGPQIFSDPLIKFLALLWQEGSGSPFFFHYIRNWSWMKFWNLFKGSKKTHLGPPNTKEPNISRGDFWNFDQYPYFLRDLNPRPLAP